MNFKVRDYYYKKAKKENFQARSVYKLEEIDQKFKILKIRDTVLDLGHYPGSWTQYCSKKVGPQGSVVGIDIKDVNEKKFPLKNITLFKKDIFHLATLNDLGVSEKFDVLLSDIAPKTTGIKFVDQDRSLNLIKAVFKIMPTFLKPKGRSVLKFFESQEAQKFLKEEGQQFKEFHYLRPKSTRLGSKELFVIAKGYKT